MADYDEILGEVESLIGRLREPLDDTLRQGGWTDGSMIQAAWVLERLRQQMSARGQVPPPSGRLNGFVRALDMQGVSGHGDALLSDIAALELRLRQLGGEEPKRRRRWGLMRRRLARPRRLKHERPPDFAPRHLRQ